MEVEEGPEKKNEMIMRIREGSKKIKKMREGILSNPLLIIKVINFVGERQSRQTHNRRPGPHVHSKAMEKLKHQRRYR